MYVCVFCMCAIARLWVSTGPGAFLASRFLLLAAVELFASSDFFTFAITGRPNGCSHIHTSECNWELSRWRRAGSSWTRRAADSRLVVFVVFSGLRNFSAAPVLQLFFPNVGQLFGGLTTGAWWVVIQNCMRGNICTRLLCYRGAECSSLLKVVLLFFFVVPDASGICWLMSSF